MGLWSGIGGAVGTVFGGPLGGTVGSGLGSLFDKKSTPKTGAEAGQYTKDYFDQFAPGTTEWERLGASTPVGSQVGAKIASEQAERTTDKQIDAQLMQTALNNRASIISSTAPLGPEGIQSGLSAYSGRKTRDYDTPAKQSREMLPFNKRASETRSDVESQKSIKNFYNYAEQGANKVEDRVKDWILKYGDRKRSTPKKSNKDRIDVMFVN